MVDNCLHKMLKPSKKKSRILWQIPIPIRVHSYPGVKRCNISGIRVLMTDPLAHKILLLVKCNIPVCSSSASAKLVGQYDMLRCIPSICSNNKGGINSWY